MNGHLDDKPEPSADQQQVVTIYDVARAAGVTIGTVSKALNGRGKLRSETRERVQLEAERLGFRPNDLAQSLMRGRSFTIGLLTTDISGRFSIPLMMGIEDALGTAQISVFLCDARDDPVREQQHIESLLAKRVDGIIVTGRRIDPRPPIDVGNTGMPVLYAFTQVGDPHALCLLSDDAQGGRLATQHLLEHSRRHIAHVTGPPYFEAVQRRLVGMREVLNEHGLILPERLTLFGPWAESWGREAVGILLATEPHIDAIFCGSDQLARGVVDALRERGVKVPDDIAVVGFDNWEVMAAAARPPLTTVDLNLYELGKLAGTKMLAMTNASSAEKEAGIIYVPCSLIIRASCGVHPTYV